MVQSLITADLKSSLKQFLEENRPCELINAYLYFIEKKFNLQPVLYPKEKVIYKSTEEAAKKVGESGDLWRQTEIKITFSRESVDENTKKIYICPFSGKVFGDNTHPNPQDAIYDWVSKCPENTERSGGLRVKRFYVSEDPEVMQKYRESQQVKAPVTKQVYSSALSGKLFNSIEGVVEDFKRNYLKPMTLYQVQNQNRYQIEGDFLEFLQRQLEEEKVAAFIQALAEFDEFLPDVHRWIGS